MTDALNEARAALHSVREILADASYPKEAAVKLLVNIAIASALISLAQEVGKIALLLRQRMPKR